MIFKNLLPLFALATSAVNGQAIREDGMIVRAVMGTDSQGSACDTKEVDLIDKTLAADIFEALMMEDAASPTDQQHRALFYYCPQYCIGISSFWCYVYTQGYCTNGVNGISPTGGWADTLGWFRRNLAAEEPAPKVRSLQAFGEDVNHRELFYYCPQYCIGISSFWCYVYTQGYCTNGVNGISPTGGWADTLGWFRRNLAAEKPAPKARSLEAVGEDVNHRELFYYCPQYCIGISSFWCYVYTQGYCTNGVNGISPTGGWADTLGWFRRRSLKTEVEALDDSHKVRFLDAGEIQSSPVVSEAHALAVQSLAAQDAISVECVAGLDMADFMFIEFEA